MKKRGILALLLTVAMVAGMISLPNASATTKSSGAKVDASVTALAEKAKLDESSANFSSSETAPMINTSGTISLNKVYLVKTPRVYPVSYFSFKAPKSGYIYFEGRPLASYVTLYANGKKVSNTAYQSWNSGSSWLNGVYFGVKKGVKYTLAVSPVYIENKGNYTDYKYFKMGVAFKAIKEKSGSKKSNAKKIKKNRARLGIIEAGKARADFYKFRVTRGGKVRIYFSGRVAATGEEMKLTVFHKSGRIKYKRTLYVSRGGTGWKLTLKGRRFVRGTYYLKVQRGESKYDSKAKLTTGFYQIKWK